MAATLVLLVFAKAASETGEYGLALFLSLAGLILSGTVLGRMLVSYVRMQGVESFSSDNQYPRLGIIIVSAVKLVLTGLSVHLFHKTLYEGAVVTVSTAATMLEGLAEVPEEGGQVDGRSRDGCLEVSAHCHQRCLDSVVRGRVCSWPIPQLVQSGSRSDSAYWLSAS